MNIKEMVTMDDMLIAVVDDDPAVVDLVKGYLTSEGYRVRGFSGGRKLFDFLQKKRPDLIILDLLLPGLDGFEVCRALKGKKEYSSIPVIILSGKDEETNKVMGLDLGADDYMVKPFSLMELNSRIKAVMRRLEPGGKKKIIKVTDRLEMDLGRYQVTINGDDIELTPAEFKILQLLSSRKGQVFTRDRILDHLWGDEKVVVARTVDVHIRHLREKLGEEAWIIKNVRGIGYKLEDKE